MHQKSKKVSDKKDDGVFVQVAVRGGFLLRPRTNDAGFFGIPDDPEGLHGGVGEQISVIHQRVSDSPLIGYRRLGLYYIIIHSLDITLNVSLSGLCAA